MYCTNLGADAVLAGIDGEAELDVGLHGVAALVLQVVGAELLAEPDAPALVAAQVDHRADSFRGDRRQGLLQLSAAIAAQRTEDVSRQALGVHPYKCSSRSP